MPSSPPPPPAIPRAFARLALRAWGHADTRSRAWLHLRARLRARLDAGKTAWVLGINAGTHDAGVAVVRADAARATLVAVHAEERLSRVKHDAGFPERALAAARAELPPDAAPEVVATWDYPAFAATWSLHLLRWFPANLANLRRPNPSFDLPAVLAAPRRLRACGLPGPLVGVTHHAAHAWGAWALSPFAADDQPAGSLVVDGTGDDASVSAWHIEGGAMRRLPLHVGVDASPGLLYQALSAAQGGWAPLHSEGRFMGAAAWGERDRSKNQVYGELRRLVRLGPHGALALDAAARWHADAARPYAGWLAQLLSPPVPPERRWNPDAVLDPESTVAPALTERRLHEAAAVQLLLEDIVAHVFDHLLRATGLTRWVWSGGVALNAVASLHLLERFPTLRLWVPPFPGDDGVAAGAALAAFAGLGPRPEPLRHAFLQGPPLVRADIERAVAGLCARDLGADPVAVGDQIAAFLAGGFVLGLAQGAAEAGPRALGHRSILADPTRPDALATLNARVKRREAVRPLAPMCTHAAARALFDLLPGASAADDAAYDHMVLCARARPGTREQIPAVVHVDGTARVQIVRPEHDLLCHNILRALGRRVGVEVCINTSLNVGEPIAHTAEDVVRTLFRAKALHGVVLVDEHGRATLVTRPDTAAGAEIMAWSPPPAPAAPTPAA